MDKPEVCNGVELVQVGTRDPEEVADHEVGSPGGQEVGQRVEDIKHILSFFGDNGVHLRCERLEPAVGIELISDDCRVVLNERFVSGKAYVHDPSVLCDRTGNKGPDKKEVVVDAVHLPDHVIACPKAVDNLIETLKPGTDPSDQFPHDVLPFKVFRGFGSADDTQALRKGADPFSKSRKAPWL